MMTFHIKYTSKNDDVITLGNNYNSDYFQFSLTSVYFFSMLV